LGLGLLSGGLVLSGCVAAPLAGYYVAAYAPSALLAGGAALSAIEQSTSSVSVQPEDKDEVRALRRLATIVTAEGSTYGFMPWPGAGSPAGSATSEGLVNGLVTSLKQNDIDVIDAFSIETIMHRRAAASNNINGQQVYNRTEIADAAFQAGADAVMLLSAVSSTNVRAGGLFWFGRGVQADLTVKTLSGRLINREGELLMTANVTYKNGQPPQEAGEAFGLVVAAIIRNPDADPTKVASR
jgi:hypothetical protein